jgi:F0F1-type ATP synthase assembly protein I
VDLEDRREMSRGFGNGLSHAFELTVTPMVVGALGLVLDRWLGLVPLFTIVFSLWGLGAAMYMTWFRYDREMRAHEATRLEARAPRPRPARWAAADAPATAGASDLRTARG